MLFSRPQIANTIRSEPPGTAVSETNLRDAAATGRFTSEGGEALRGACLSQGGPDALDFTGEHTSWAHLGPKAAFHAQLLGQKLKQAPSDYRVQVQRWASQITATQMPMPCPPEIYAVSPAAYVLHEKIAQEHGDAAALIVLCAATMTASSGDFAQQKSNAMRALAYYLARHSSAHCQLHRGNNRS